MNKKILLALFLLVVLGGIFAYFKQSKNLQSTQSSNSKLKVVATFYPLAEFSKQVGGDLVEVSTLVPAGTEPHDFEPTTQDIARLNSAQVFVYNGAGFEGWINKVLPDLKKNNISLVDSSVGITLQQIDPSMAEGTSTIDPHIWLDPVLNQQQLKNITAAFIAADPAHAAQYQSQSDQYLLKLQKLDSDFKSGLANCQTKQIVTSHAAFGYLADEYGLKVTAIAGLSPEEEPSPQRLAAIVKQVKAQGIKYIFFETLVSPTLANTIATETGAKTLVFNPLEGLTQTDIDSGKEYISVQEQNLQNVRTALSCQ